MKIRMNDTVATPHGSYDRGQIYDVDDAWGAKIVEGGQAVEVGADDKPTSSGSEKADSARKEAERAAADPAHARRQTMDRRTGLPVEKVEANLAAGKTATGSQLTPSDPNAHAPATPVLAAVQPGGVQPAATGPGLTTQSVLGAPPAPVTDGSRAPAVPAGAPDAPPTARTAAAAPGSISAPQASQTPAETTARASEGKAGNSPTRGTTAAERSHGSEKTK